MARDYSREAAHRRYEQAYGTADAAGAITQAAVNNAYLNLLQNTEWTPEEGWAEQYQEGPEAYRPASYLESGWAQTDYGTPYSASSYSVAPEEESKIADPVTMGTDEDNDLESKSGYEDQQNQDQQQQETSPLSPMVEKIGSMSQQVDQMSADDRFELAKQRYQQNSGESDFSDSIQGSLYQPLYEQGLLSESQIKDSQRRLQGDNPAYWNFLGFTSQEKTPEDVRAVYDTGFESLGNIEPTSKGADTESRQNFDPVMLQIEMPGYDELGQPLNGGDRIASDKLDLGTVPFLKDIFQVDRNLIDDGRSEDSREAMFMTGEQYLRYKQQFGLPGRPDRLIDPDEIYNKQEEMENYGFVPYLVTDEGLGRFHDRASTNAVSNVFNDLSNVRRNATDYTIAYNGKEYSGKDFDRSSAVWNKTFQREMDEINADMQNRLVTDKSQASEFAIPHVEQWTVQVDGQGPVTRRDEPSDMFYGPMDNQPGDFHIVWPDGQVWNFDDAEAAERELSIGYSPAQSPEEEERAVAWYEMTPLELDDGSKIRADKAITMIGDIGANKDAYSNYGTGGMGRPVANGPMDGVEGVDLAPWLVDLFAGSAPLFYGPTAAAQAAAGGMNAYQGMKPGSDDYLNRTYSMVAQDPTEDQRKTATFGNVALPLTERLWGPVGGSVFKPVANVAAKKFGHANPGLRYLMGIGGEAAEEVPGNIVEQMMSGTGIGGWYGNQMYRDHDNNIVPNQFNADGSENVLAYDEQGTAIRDVNTPLDQRLANLFADAPEAMLGGGAFGALLGPLSIPRYMREYAASQNNIRPGYSENVVVPINTAERLYYDRNWNDESTF